MLHCLESTIMGDNFKCSMCTFLLAELERLKSNLFEQSIQPYIFKDVGIQTCNDITTTSEISNENYGCDTPSLTLNTTSNKSSNTTSLLLHEQSFSSFRDNIYSSTIVEDVVSESSHNSQTSQEIVTFNEEDIDSPYQLISGKPFAEFNVKQLLEEMKFTRIGEREVKYFGVNTYSYGKTVHQPCEIPEGTHLSGIVERAKSIFHDHSFNSVLVTKYPDGNAHLPMHSDDEEDISDNSFIFTVSLGASRTINFQQKSSSAPVTSVKVEHGDVYVMSKKSQEFYKHGIPRDFGKATRVSLTFRHIIVPETVQLNNNEGAECNGSLDSVADFLLKLGAPSQTMSTKEDSTHSMNDVREHNEHIDTLFISSNYVSTY